MGPKRMLVDAESNEQSGTSAAKRSRAASTIPVLPPALERLDRLFQNLNTFCAFCDAHLTTAMTFNHLKASITELQLQDLAAINVVMPGFIQINHSEDATDVLVVQFGKPVSKEASRKKHADVLKNRGDEWRQPRAVKPEAIKRAIAAKNRQWKQALAAYMKKCQKECSDPEARLYGLAKEFLPNVATPSNQEAVEPLETSEPFQSMSDVIAGLRTQGFYRDQLEDGDRRRIYPEKVASYGKLDETLSPEITQLLEQKAKARIISGKSLIYQIPVLEKLLKDRTSRAMYIYPTKALAQDQLRSLDDLIKSCPSLSDVKVYTFDGDTPSEQRRLIREEANIIFTNPDMLHHSILPNAKQWRWFLQKLTHIVVDELHVYNGLFGTNVALIMRRLRRLCNHYWNSHVVCVSCSATISKPDEVGALLTHISMHMKLIFGVDHVKLINEDGAPHALHVVKEFILWNPPYVNPNDISFGRKSAITESAELLEYLLTHNVRTIAFCKLRKTCEMLMKQLRENLLSRQRKDLLDRVMSYRGGYMPQERRKIEKKLFDGELLAVVATNALELGVDIGTLDAVIMVGFPWSISALWQQSGRAGRRKTDSLSVVVADQSAMDQYYVNNPSELFEKRLDDIHFQVEDSIVLESHLQCAAEELPVNVEQDQLYFGPKTKKLCEEHLVPISNEFINIRNATDEVYAVVDVTDNRHVILEEIETARAPFEIYEGAIFIHQGKPYLVEECNIDQRYAKVHLTQADWTTAQRDYTDVNPINTLSTKPVHGTRHMVHFGEVQVETVVFGYYRLDKRNRVIDACDLYMDPVIRQSTGMWTDIPTSALSRLEELDIDPMATVHSAAHALISLLPQFGFATGSDIRTECKSPHATRKRPPRIPVYETQPCGLVRQGYHHFDELVRLCIERIETCPCDYGCPNCVLMSTCSEHNMVCSKEGALIAFKAMLNGE
ncbi:hypothetical protein EC973_006198 [Apophysomyces ossiformis]|uniref:P-loop containing nucleoside triphosphate hydrolase protein n=1 Tax=Apophysomyces ossiformis TaxID=679940 RepID=A0A8H7EQM3_9FUNG|nr:hypothetical protein EC973_006198 [Apophysomyces ossiformis]